MSTASLPIFRHAALARWVRLAGILACFVFSAAAGRATDDKIIYPRSASGAPSTETNTGSEKSAGNPSLLVVAAIAAGAGGWFLWRQRKHGFARSKVASKLALAETRPLGNRQFLVVATYQDKKFLLGVCPGRIELLTRLDDSTPAS